CVCVSRASATAALYTLSLHDALPIYGSTLRELRRLATPHMETLCGRVQETVNLVVRTGAEVRFLSSVESSQILHVGDRRGTILRSEEHTSELQSRENLVCRLLLEKKK